MPLEAVELFTGMGGLALGLERAGFKHLALVEWDKDSHQTLADNHPKWPAGQPTDVREYDYSHLPIDIALLAGGPPCQPFSLGGKHRGQADHRNMFPEVVRAQRALRPKAVLVENVYGLNRPAFRPYREYISLQLRYPFVPPIANEDWEAHKARIQRAAATRQPLDQTYDVTFSLINAADYGAPQIRRRVLFVGFRRDLGIQWTPPRRTHSQEALQYAQTVTGSYWSEHGLPAPRPLRTGAAPCSDDAPPLRWQTVRDAIRGLPEPVDGQENPIWRNHVGIPGARVYAGHTGNVLDRPAKAVKAGDHGCPGGEHVLVRGDGSLRYFTVREVCRLQGFPNDVYFTCSRTEAMRQLGNAVPVPVAETFGGAVAAALIGSSEANMACREVAATLG